MNYLITDIGEGNYLIEFNVKNNEPTQNSYYFETSEIVENEDIDHGINEGFKNIPELSIEKIDSENLKYVIHYIPNNILRIIDRTNKIMNKFIKVGFKVFAKYEQLFSENLLPFGRFIGIEPSDIITDKNLCDGLLYNEKIINEQINNPKNSISNCLSYLQDNDIWSKPWTDNSENIQPEVEQQNEQQEVEQQNDKPKIEQSNIEQLNNQSEVNQQGGYELSEENKRLMETIEAQQRHIKELQNYINELEYKLTLDQFI